MIRGGLYSVRHSTREDEIVRTTDVDISGIADVLADAAAVADCVASGKPIPPELARRVRDEAEKITQRLQAQFGSLDIGVPAIREVRGELPE